MRSPRKVWVRRSALALVGLIAIGLAGAWRMGTALVEPAPRTIGAAPADLVALDVTIPSASGSMLHGWWMEADAQREVTRSRELEGQTEVAQQHSTEARAPSSRTSQRSFAFERREVRARIRGVA